MPDVTETLAVHDPTDGRVVGDTPTQSREEVQQIASRLRAAQPAWEALGPRQRAVHVGRLRDWVLDHQDELVDLLRKESGKAMPDASLEAMGIVDVMTYFAGQAEQALSDEGVKPHGPLTMSKQLELRRRPYQLVGIITPWNFPLTLPVMDAIPALLAGASVILKPSEYTPLALQRMVRAWTEELGAPDVFALALGTGDVGESVVEVADYVQFTGSTVTGRKIGVRCAERLIPCGLELGGKDPMIVLADAAIERAANGAAWGGLFNAGQVCTSVERVYIEDAVYEEFVDLLVERVRTLRTGPSPNGELRDVGAMANLNQLEIVERQVNDAVANGARVLTGGRRIDGPGFYYEPTVLVDVDHDMLVMREETFGPVIPVMRVADVEEAIERANDSQYGLSASVWTGSRDRGLQIARRLEAGAVNVNDVFSNLFALGLPMAGWKRSGLGARLGGDSAIQKYCRTQAVTAAKLTPATEIAWYPYASWKTKIAGRIVRLSAARDLRRRLGV